MLVSILTVVLTTAFPARGDELVRIMAANTTSGNRQSYDPGEGRRIFQGLDPDIVLIQEFNYGNNSPSELRQFVDSAFGSEFHYYREGGNEQIPNGVISRYPIVQSGEWADSAVSNRDFAWARIDIPGDRHLWAISVHLLTSGSSVRDAEATALVSFVQSQVPEGDYLVIGGDFNTGGFSEAALATLSTVVDTTGRPRDQRGTTGTNGSRAKPYDQVLPGPDLSAMETPLAISGHSYKYGEGLVFDSRVFTPLSAVSPVLPGDSGSSGMQHMAVVRDFLVATGGDSGGPTEYPANFAGVSTSNSISLSWSEVTSAPVPDGYLVKASASPVIAAPVDGVDEGDDADLSDGSARMSVSAGVGTVAFEGLPDDTPYHFEIYPFTTDGGVDYKTDGGTPSVSVATLAGTGSVPAAPILGSVHYPHESGFTVTWNRSAGATNYRLDVATGPDFSGSGPVGLLSEGFDAGNGIPSGWVNGGTENDSIASHYASAGNCRALGAGDSLETPPVDHPVELSFYVDSSNGGDGMVGSVSYSVDGAGWQSLDSFTVGTGGERRVIGLTGSPNLSGMANVRFRFESSFFTWYLDDVLVRGTASGSLLPGYGNLATGDVSHHAVDGLDPDTEYFFRIRAENGNGSGADSAVGSQRTPVSGTPFSVWAAAKGIAPADMLSDFDQDSCTDFEEYVFGTDPTHAGSGPGRIFCENSPGGFKAVYRRSIAPGISWQYLGGGILPLAGPPLAPGAGYHQYEILSVERFGDYERVEISVKTGADPVFFLKVLGEP